MRNIGSGQNSRVILGLVGGLFFLAGATFWYLKQIQTDPQNVPQGRSIPTAHSNVATAVVIVDIQKDFWVPEVSASHAHFEENVAELLRQCRQLKLPLFHVRTTYDETINHWPDAFHDVHHSMKLCQSGTEGSKPLPCAKELLGESVFVKGYFDAFSNPEFAQKLIDSGTSHVVVCGLYTDVGVQSRVQSDRPDRLLCQRKVFS